MFKKKAKAEQQRRARQDARKAVLAQFDKDFEDILRCDRPVEKFQRLETLRDTIAAAIELAEEQLKSEAEKRQLKTGLGFGSGAIALTIGTVAAFHFPPALIALCLPLYLGAGTLGGERVRDRYLAAERPLIEPFIEALKAQRGKVDAAAKEVVAASVKNLGASADLAVLLAAAPQLRDEFLKAQGKQSSKPPATPISPSKKGYQP